MVLRLLLTWLGFRRWEDIDGDGPFTLQECAWTGERRTVVRGRHLRLLTPNMKPRWKAWRMALRTLKPRLSSMAPRLKTAREVRDTRYSPDAKVRVWYKSKRWADLRQQVLVRDLYTCQHTGIMLTSKAPAPDSPVVHHKVPHKGDERLFWDINNLEAVSKEWHDSEAQSKERSICA